MGSLGIDGAGRVVSLDAQPNGAEVCPCCAVHLPTAEELWQEVKEHQHDPGYWIYRQAVLDGAPWHWVDTLALLQSAHDEMLRATGKAFAVLTAERYFSLGSPGCRGRLNSAGFDWQRDGKANIKLVRLP